jgi:hypothetical protein
MGIGLFTDQSQDIGPLLMDTGLVIGQEQDIGLLFTDHNAL